jgi:hypothetical protein
MARILSVLVVSFLFSIIFAVPFALADINVTVDVVPATMSMNATSPTNTTYSSIPILLTVHTNINANITWSMNGNANQTACLNCTSFNNSVSGNITAGSNRIDIYAVDSTNSTNTYSETIYFTYSPPIPPSPPEHMMFGVIPVAMGAGYILFLVGLFIGSPKSPKELIEFTMAGVIIGLVVITAIGLIVGLI